MPNWYPRRARDWKTISYFYNNKNMTLVWLLATFTKNGWTFLEVFFDCVVMLKQLGYKKLSFKIESSMFIPKNHHKNRSFCAGWRSFPGLYCYVGWELDISKHLQKTINSSFAATKTFKATHSTGNVMATIFWVLVRDPFAVFYA